MYSHIFIYSVLLTTVLGMSDVEKDCYKSKQVMSANPNEILQFRSSASQHGEHYLQVALHGSGENIYASLSAGGLPNSPGTRFTAWFPDNDPELGIVLLVHGGDVTGNISPDSVFALTVRGSTFSAVELKERNQSVHDWLTNMDISQLGPMRFAINKHNSGGLQLRHMDQNKLVTTSYRGGVTLTDPIAQESPCKSFSNPETLYTVRNLGPNLNPRLIVGNTTTKRKRSTDSQNLSFREKHRGVRGKGSRSLWSAILR